MRSLVWFREKDFRVGDHAPLVKAVEDGEVIPLFVLDPDVLEAGRGGQVSPRRQFLLDSLKALEERIQELGSCLVVVTGRSLDLLPDLASRWRVDQVLAYRCGEPFGVERDFRIEQALGKASIKFCLFEGETLVPPGSVRTGAGSMFHVFTPFAKAFHRQACLGRPLPAPRELPPLPILDGLDTRVPNPVDLGHSRNSRLLRGGVKAAHARMNTFLEQGLEGYRLGRDLMAEDGTSRLSSDLHFGTLSVRTLWHAVSMRSGEAPDGAACYLNELLWREFAHHLLALEPSLVSRPFRSSFEGFPWRQDHQAWEAWTQGRTGFPVVDAAARQLLSEGYVHNRARMVAACFLAKHLLLDYRLGEAHYLERLVDGDLANNNLGWQWSAGCGVDAQPWFRIFNPTAQGERFDPEGTYVKRWVPELTSCPARWIHRPWEAPQDVRQGLNYPSPIIDHGIARARFLDTAKMYLKPMK